MARAVVRSPRVFLMDEPLSNLDAKLRVQMRAEIARLQLDLGVTTIYVTHDQVEAMTMGSRIAVMRKGILQQLGPPQEVYDRPVNLFVAGFIGSPAMNIFHGIIERADGRMWCALGSERIPLSSGRDLLAAQDGQHVAVGIRPEDVASVSDGTRDIASLNGEVTAVESLGSERLVHFQIDAKPVLTDEIIEIASDVDAAAVWTLEEEARAEKVTIIGKFGAQSSFAVREHARLTLPADRLRFFDLETGAAIR
jgi:multiple sugar transport system ATP-binding protein